jgi:MFS family permease
MLRLWRTKDGGMRGLVTSRIHRLPFHYGWVIVGVAIVGNMVAAGASFWSVAVYIPAIADDFEVDRGPVVGAFMVGNLLFSLLGPFAGRYIDRRGARNVLIAGTFIGPLALVGASQATNLWQLYLGWAAAGAARTLIMPIPFNWVITRWFEGRRRQAALGVITTGFGLGGAAFLPLMDWIEGRADWHAAVLTSAGIMFVVFGLASLLVVANHPRDIDLEPVRAGDEPASSEDRPEWGFDVASALRTRVFWTLSLALMLFFLGQGAVTTLGVDFFVSREVGAGAVIIAASALLRTIFRLPLGLGLSRVERVYRLAILVALSQAAALFLLVAWTNTAGITGFILLWGVGGAFAPMLEPLLVTRTLGVRHFGAVSGTVALIAFGGQFVGPLAGAALFDASGSYGLPFALYGAGFLGTALLMLATAAAIRGDGYRRRARAAGLVLDDPPAAEAAGD